MSNNLLVIKVNNLMDHTIETKLMTCKINSDNETSYNLFLLQVKKKIGYLVALSFSH